MCVIFSDRCWVVDIPFVGVVKFKFLAHFPVDHLADITIIINIIIIIIIIIINSDFSTTALGDDRSLKFELKRLFFRFEDSFQKFWHASPMLGIISSASVTIIITVTFMFSSFFVIWQDISICHFFRFLFFLI